MVPRINTRRDRVLLAMVLHTITPAMGALCRCKAKAGLRRSSRGLHTQTRLSSLLRLNLDSSLKTTWFHSAASQFSRAGHHSKRRCRWVGVKSSTRNGPAIPNVIQLGAFVWFEKTQGPLVEVLHVPGWRPINQLAVRVHFLRCGGLLDDEGS
ncbi:e3 ubiquitin-protein ligase RNF13 [Trichonephila clavipes]|nr:e3 ubiquitin-protein ligase RNF13 [Trichonephila clavipes]